MNRIAICASFPVHVLPGMGDGSGAGHHATWLPRIARALEGIEGPQLHWIVCSKAVDRRQHVAAFGQQFHLLPRRKLSWQMLTSFHGERRAVAALLRELDPCLVHGWGSEEGYGYAATDWHGLHLLSMQGLLTEYCRASPQPWLLRWQACHERRVLRKVKRLTVESPWGRDRLAAMAPQAEVRLWEYGVDPACAGIVREPQARPLALYVGTLSRLKGVDTLLEAFRDPRLAQVELVLLGDGPLRSAQRHAAPQVRFLGHRPVAEVRDWMAKAWCLVHPARADTSPNAVKEARAAGLPVITTRHGGQAQYVEEGVSGCFHAVGDAAGIVDGVLAFTRDRQWSLAAGAAGRDEILGVLDAHLTGSRLLAIYQEILESGKLQAA